MKGVLAAFEAAIAVALAIVAVQRLSNPIPAGDRFIARATMRAVAVPVNDAVDVAGFALHAMHVDVLISGTPPRTTTLLENIEVLSAGRYFEKGAEGKSVAVQVVNLLVTSEQAEQLSLASHKTAIHLVMHNPLNRKVPPSPADVPPPMPNKWVRPVMDDVPPPPPPVMEIELGIKADVPPPCGFGMPDGARTTRAGAACTP